MLQFEDTGDQIGGDDSFFMSGLFIQGKGLNADQIEAIDQNLLEMTISHVNEQN